MSLFAPDTTMTAIALPNASLSFLEQLTLPWPNAQVMARLIAETDWKAEHIVLWGKRHLQPRLTAWYGERAYAYSGLTLTARPLTPLLETIRQALEAVTGHPFNSVLLNYYRDGQDSMGMHSDDEAELGPAPAIASFSLGATRSFVLKQKGGAQRLKVDLSDGNVLLMAGSTQQYWLHGLPKSARSCGPRLNLTFRYIH